MDIRFGAKFSIYGSKDQLSEAHQILTDTAQKQGITIAFSRGFVPTQGLVLVYTGPDADSFNLVKPEGDLHRMSEVEALERDYYGPAERTVKEVSQDFSTTHTNCKLTSGKPNFDLLTLEPIPTTTPVEGQQ